MERHGEITEKATQQNNTQTMRYKPGWFLHVHSMHWFKGKFEPESPLFLMVNTMVSG